MRFESPMAHPISTTPDIKPREFQLLREYVVGKFGLDLRDGKEKLVCTRLGKHMQAGGFRSFQDYLSHVQTDSTGESLVQLINALTTNHTAFLREAEHFRFLSGTLLPGWSTRKSIKIWCAASSTGEEPYTILFTLLDALPKQSSADVQVLATDISTRVLQIAKEGIYSADKLRTMPPSWLQTYFKKLDPKSTNYQVRPEFRQRIEFRRLNLMDPFPSSVQYPAIFCRNVMIYFGKETQTNVVRKLSELLEQNGHLFVGHSESLTGIDHRLKYVKPAVYRKSA